MSKRGRRRNSKRRKSSSSSKQSPSPSIFQKQIKSDSVSYRDDNVEKGEKDSLRKENVFLRSDDKESYINAPPQEKRYKLEHDVTSFPGHGSVFTKTTEVSERGVKIVTSVCVNDVEDSAPKIMFQRSQEPSSENPAISTQITNIFQVNCTGLHVKVEIQEAVQRKTYDEESTCVVSNESRSNTEMNIKRKCESIWMMDNEPSQPSLPNVTGHTQNQMTNSIFTFGRTSEQSDYQNHSKSVCSTNIWANPIYCQCCGGPNDLKLTNYSPSSPLMMNRKLQAKREDGFMGDDFWDIPPPQEFADNRYNPMEDLTHDLAFLQIGGQSPAYTEESSFQPAFTAESRCTFYFQGEEGEDVAPCLDQLSESDNYEPMFMRPSLSTNRSSFTKDFIYCQRRKSWIRNNSIAAVEHRICSSLKKRRQTFPGMSQRAGWMQDDFQLPYHESYTSSITCLLPFQTERLKRIKRLDEELSPFGTGNDISSKAQECQTPVSVVLNTNAEKQELLHPFYTSSWKDHSNEHDPRQSSNDCHDTDLKHNICKSIQRFETETCEYKVDQNDPIDSSFDQEFADVEYFSSETLAEERLVRGLSIQVIPPSCSGSEEQILQSQPLKLVQNNFNSSQCESESAFHEQNSSNRIEATDALREKLPQRNSASSCMHPVQDTDGHSFPRNEGTDEAELKPAETTASSCTQQPITADKNDLPLAKGGSGTECSTRPTETAQHPDSTKELHVKADKPNMYKSSKETKEHLKPVAHKDWDGSGSDHWAKRRNIFKESRQWSSAGGSSITSDITEESVSEDTHSTDIIVPDNEDRGFYTETFHSSAWIYQGDDESSGSIHPSLTTRARPISIRERTVKISKGTGEYPWGFRIQFSKPIVVTEVDTNGAAEEAGLMVGDYVLAVNGIDVTSIPHSEAANLARQGPDVLTLTIGSDIAHGPNTPRPPCRGYLHKRTQSGLIKGWRKRWFVLTHDCCLYYYKHKRDEGKRRALSSVKLEGAEVGPDNSLGKPFVFRCHPQFGNRVYLLCATSNQEMKRWLEAMKKAIYPITQNHVWVDVTRHNSNLPPLAVKNPDCLGLLHKMDKSKDMWVQHYCILKDGCLYLYSGIRATHAQGGMYLQGYTVREQPYGSKKSTMELKPPSDEFQTFYLWAENSAENNRWMIAIKASVKKWLPLHQALQDYVNQLPEETRM
ncbi:unnamed protein product [Menidia menidia]|uniref:(Atlantic silverside) hypothetical protein n=1 Tax=Menidia menidia TaxID=238744 RepID=A0A8S4AJL2_9TELE|nr:unnamed protein product [Menidia menidia]